MTDLTILTIEERMKKKIREANFNRVEFIGFQNQPELAILAGMAMGYKMALEDYYGQPDA